MRYWWVNQNQSHDQEIGGGYMWSPKTRIDGVQNQFYKNMTEVQPGDVVFSFYGTRIPAIGRAIGAATSSPVPPEFGSTGDQWAATGEGWLVPVEYAMLSDPIRPKDHMAVLRPLLPERYSPLRATGDGNQGTYLAAVPKDLAETLLQLIGYEADRALASVNDETVNRLLDDEAERRIAERPDLEETQRESLVKSRIGQGLFKARLKAIESRCRVTGVTVAAHLIGSHIKPWRVSTNAEKLDGNNGLLLSPHVDHLFDRGFISFEDDGSMIVSDLLDPTILAAWSVDPSSNFGDFTPSQSEYLDYHRRCVLKPNTCND
jgi:putative restriction endonuclease